MLNYCFSGHESTVFATTLQIFCQKTTNIEGKQERQ
jgi:hypothetical protein